MAGTICTTASSYLGELGKLLGRVDAAAIDRLAGLLFEAWRDRRRVFVFGNGGSAATASHWVADLVKTAAVEGHRRLQAMCLSDNAGLLTAIGNDISYDEVFRYALASHGQRGDLAVGISCSGNSPNVLRACEWARENGLTIIGLTGFGGGKLRDLSDLHINVPSDNFGIVEDLHLAVGHIVAQVLCSRVRMEPA